MYIRPKRLTTSSNLKIYYRNFCTKTGNTADNEIEVVSVYKYLGVTVDEHLTWKFHIENIQKKLRSASFALNNLKYCTNAKIMKIVYMALAEAHIRYGIAAWGSSTHSSDLQKSQNRVLKSLKPTTDYLNVESIYKLTILKEFHKILTPREIVQHQHHTRWQCEGRYKVPRFRNNFERRTLECTVPRICNSIPVAVLNIKSQHQRKKKLKEYFIQEQNKNQTKF